MDPLAIINVLAPMLVTGCYLVWFVVRRNAEKQAEAEAAAERWARDHAERLAEELQELDDIAEQHRKKHPGKAPGKAQKCQRCGAGEQRKRCCEYCGGEL